MKQIFSETQSQLHWLSVTSEPDNAHCTTRRHAHTVLCSRALNIDSFHSKIMRTGVNVRIVFWIFVEIKFTCVLIAMNHGLEL